MSDSECEQPLGCFSTLLSAASLLNLDFLNEQPLADDVQITNSDGDSEEVMIGDLQSGEETHPSSDVEGQEFGTRDGFAAMDYAKKTTTTETEPEENFMDESRGYTTAPPESQVMGIQSNVVPVPTESIHSASAPAPPSERTNESIRNRVEGALSPSVGHSARLADLNSDLEDNDETMLPNVGQQRNDTSPIEATGSYPSPDLMGNVEEDLDGSVRELPDDEIGSGDSPPKSSPTLSIGYEGQSANSPVALGTEPETDDKVEHQQRTEAPGLSNVTASERALPPDLFNGLSQTASRGTEQSSDSVRQTMEQMAQQRIGGIQNLLSAEGGQSSDGGPKIEEVQSPTEISTSTLPPPTTSTGTGPGPSVQRSSGPTLPALPSRTRGLGTGGLPPRNVGGSGQQSSGPSGGRAPMPAGIGGSSGLPARQRPPQPPPQPQQQAPPPQQQPQAPPPQPQRQPVARTAVVQPREVPANQRNGGEGSSQSEAPDVVEARRKLYNIRLTMYRIVNRLGLNLNDFSLNEFMAKVDRTEQLRFRGPGMIRDQLDTLVEESVRLDEQEGPNSDLDVSVTVLVLGLAGSGKTSVIRNMLNPGASLTSDFAPESTTKISVHTGKVCGITFNMIDTPGLSVAASALRKNMTILKNVRSMIAKHKPDTVIYVDRLDLFRKEFSDAPVLRLVNEMLPEMLYNCVALLTRACAPPPNCGQGEMNYNQYYKFRLDVFRQVITYAISDMRWAGKPMGFENHPNCRVNTTNVPVLPNGVAFKKAAIFQVVASHMSSQIEKVCKTRLLQRRTMEQMMYMMQPRKQLQLSALVAQLLTPKPPKKFPDEESELMTRREINRLPTEEEKIEEENKRRDYTRLRKVEILQEEAHPSQVPIVGASMELNPSFDHEVTQHRYNATDFVSGWSVRPIISAQDSTFDHDDGVEMFQVAREGVLRKGGKCVDGCPASMILQAGKGKNIGNVTMETGMSYYATRGVVATAGAVVHPAGQDSEVVYTPTLDIRAKVTDSDKVTVGGMACRLAESGWPHKGQVALGGKLENKYKIKDGVKVTGSVGAMTVKASSTQARDTAYGANVELKLAGGKGEFDPNFLFSGGVSHQQRGTFKRTGFSGQVSGEQAISPETMLNGRLQMSAGGSGTLSARLVTHDKPQTGWLLALPIIIKSVKRLLGHGDEFV